MAAVTDSGQSLNSTANATSYASPSLTPAANDLLVVFVAATETVSQASMSDSQGLGWTKITSATWSATTHTLYCFVANALAAASAMTVTFDCTGDDATGCIMHIARVSGMGRTGASAVRQSAVQSNQAGSTTPAPVFGSAALTDNPVLGAVATNDAINAITQPSGWTERNELTITGPSARHEYVSKDSGFTGTTVTWGSNPALGYADIIVEMVMPVQYNQTFSTSAGAAATSPKQINKIVQP
jgi:hypothetical protein